MSVLLLEEDMDLREEIVSALRQKGIPVDVADDFEQARAKIMAGNVAVFICEYEAQLNGKTSQTLSLNQLQSTTDLLITTSTQQSYINQEVRLIAKDCFEVPFPVEMLVQVVRFLTKGKLTEAEVKKTA